MNTVDIPFFKNQTKTVSVSCIINKIMPYSFIKSAFQPEILHLQNHHNKTFSLSVHIKNLILTPYFYTYDYDNKNEVYCIVEVNRIKKVLIMER